MGDFKEWGQGDDFEMEREGGGVDIHLQTMIFEKPEACSYTTKASCIYKEKVIMNLTLEKVFLL